MVFSFSVIRYLYIYYKQDMENRRLIFIENANRKFNNSYNYDKFIYVDNLSKSIVTCPKHGDFEVTAAHHTSSSKFCGCRKCWLDNKNNKLIEKHKADFVKCKEAALKYETKPDFKKNDRLLYNMSYRLGIIDEICSHMIKVGNLYHRCIYSYEFVNLKSVYVGLTYDISARDKQHRCSGSVFSFATNNKANIPKPKKLTDYINKNDAIKLEENWLKKYKNEGWLIINKVKTGGLGGRNRHINYTKEDCFYIASKYNKVSDCAKENFKVCQILRKNGWIKEAFPQVFDKFKIVCFNLDGNFIKIFDTPTSASIELQIPISRISSCITNKSKYAHGYQFMKKTEWEKFGSKNKIGSVVLKRSNSVKIIQLSIDLKFINEFESIADAIKYLGKKENDRASITKACKGRLKTAYGYKWIYKTDYKI